MKRLLLVSLCLTSFAVNAMQQEQRSPLRQQLDNEAALQQPLLGDSDGTEMRPFVGQRTSEVPLVVVENMAVAGGGASPARPVVATQAASPDQAFQAVLSERDIQDLFAREPALKKLTEAQQELLHGKIDQVMIFVREMLEADKDQDEARKLSKKQRIAASAMELGILTPGMMLYSFFLDRGGYNNAAIVQHYTAGSWLRNTRNSNHVAKIIVGVVLVGVSHYLDYHVFMPYLGNQLGFSAVSQFFTLGAVLNAVAQVNPIERTKETFCATFVRFKNWACRKKNQLPS